VEIGTFGWLKDQAQTKLEADRKGLEDRLKTLEDFLANRVDWSTQLRTISGDMPESTLLTSFQGGGAPRGQMVVNFTTPLTSDGVMPPEINEFITALRDEPVLKKNFPIIDVTGLQAKNAQGKQGGVATYSVVCQPAAQVKANAPKKGPGAR
jgi:hypothetical protein